MCLPSGTGGGGGGGGDGGGGGGGDGGSGGGGCGGGDVEPARVVTGVVRMTRVRYARSDARDDLAAAAVTAALTSVT